MTNLRLKDFAQNRIWIAVVQLATELTAWMQMLALPCPHPPDLQPQPSDQHQEPHPERGIRHPPS